MEEHLKYDVSRHFDEVKRRDGAFVEGATTALAAENSVTQIGGALQLGGLGRVAVRTVYEKRAEGLV